MEAVFPVVVTGTTLAVFAVVVTGMTLIVFAVVVTGLDDETVVVFAVSADVFAVVVTGLTIVMIGCEAVVFSAVVVWVSVFGIPLQRFKDNAVRRDLLDDSILFII